MLTAIIVDDEPLARRGLKLRLESLDAVECICECANGRQALEAIAEHSPDLVFLDIQMPGLSGFDVIDSLQQDNLPMIIFVTAYDQYAIEAFDIQAIDYLLKPIDPERLAQSVERAQAARLQEQALQDKQQLLDLVMGITGKSATSVGQLLEDTPVPRAYPERIAIKDGENTTLVNTRDIEWVDAAGDYMCVHANEETFIMRITMKDLESQLNPEIFQRVHRSTIVNLKQVSRLCSHMNGEYHLVLNNGQSVKMSRSYKEKIKHFL